MEKQNVVEIGNNIMIKGADLQKGLWRSLNKLASDPGLEFTAKTRVAVIFRELDKQTRDFQAEYDKQTESLKWEGTGPNRKCLEEEKLQEINKQFEEKTFVILGKKIKGAQLQKAAVSAQDLIALEPILEGVF